MKFLSTIFLLTLSPLVLSAAFAFSPTARPSPPIAVIRRGAKHYPSIRSGPTVLRAKRGSSPPSKISQKRRQQLGINDDEDEYDLYFALDNNTDPLITKLIAGSLIVAILALLVAGVVVPSLTDYGEGVCNPITTGGRC